MSGGGESAAVFGDGGVAVFGSPSAVGLDCFEDLALVFGLRLMSSPREILSLHSISSCSTAVSESWSAPAAHLRYVPLPTMRLKTDRRLTLRSPARVSGSKECGSLRRARAERKARRLSIGSDWLALLHGRAPFRKGSTRSKMRFGQCRPRETYPNFRSGRRLRLQARAAHIPTFAVRGRALQRRQ